MPHESHSSLAGLPHTGSVARRLGMDEWKDVQSMIHAERFLGERVVPDLLAGGKNAGQKLQLAIVTHSITMKEYIHSSKSHVRQLPGFKPCRDMLKDSTGSA